MGSTGRVMTARGPAVSRGGKSDRGAGTASSGGRASATGLESASASGEPGIVGTGISACAGAAAWAVTGTDGEGAAGAVVGADSGGSGDPASRGLSILEGDSSATGPSPVGIAGSGAAVWVSAFSDALLPARGATVGVIRMLAPATLVRSACRDTGEVGVSVRIVGAGGRDVVERLAGRSGLTAEPCASAGTGGTRSAMLTRDVSAPRAHGGAGVAQTSPKIRAAWRRKEQMKARPIPSSGRRLTPWLRLKGEYRRDRRNHPARGSASCPGSLMSTITRGRTSLLADRPARQALYGPQDLHGAQRSREDVVRTVLLRLRGTR